MIRRPVSLTILLVMGPLANSSYAYDCSSLEVWSPGSSYTGGDQVQCGGTAYQAKWWTQSDPATSGQWEALG